MSKVDYKQTLSTLYKPSAKAPALVDVPPMNFLMIDGQGDPNTQPYWDAVEALYSVAYTVKFAIKKTGGTDFSVMPLEALWWGVDGGDFVLDDRTTWAWTAMIMQPEVVTADHIAEAREQAAKKKDLPALPRLRFECFHEGPVAQILHLGPFSEETPNIYRLHDAIHEHGGELSGKHHEIYLSDLRKTAPEKLRTILRAPYTG